MEIRLKPIGEQVVVMTGASSGIGLVTAKRAAERGAKVVLVARNEHDLVDAVQKIRDEGGRAIYQVADVADPEQFEEIANAAVREFGRIDTWVNNAGTVLHGRSMDVSLDDMRRQFDVLYWGEVYGTRAAVPHLMRQGGAIINVASAPADRAAPLQGDHCAATHALAAFTDTLRMELEEEGAPISVTLVKPASVDTSLFDKAKSYLTAEPRHEPADYELKAAAEAIIEAAQRPVRDGIHSNALLRPKRVALAAAGLGFAAVAGVRVRRRLRERARRVQVGVVVDADPQPVDQLAAEPAGNQREQESDQAEHESERGRVRRIAAAQPPADGEEHHDGHVSDRVPNANPLGTRA